MNKKEKEWAEQNIRDAISDMRDAVRDPDAAHELLDGATVVTLPMYDPERAAFNVKSLAKQLARERKRPDDVKLVLRIEMTPVKPGKRQRKMRAFRCHALFGQ